MPHSDLAAMAAAAAPPAASVDPDLIPRNEAEVSEKKQMTCFFSR